MRSTEKFFFVRPMEQQKAETKKMAYRFDDVAGTLAQVGLAAVLPLPIVINVDDQVDTLRTYEPRGRFLRNHGPDRLAHRDANQNAFGVVMHLVRGFVPEVTQSSTGWLSAPIWPRVLATESQVRARSYRIEAEADGNHDAATESALIVRRSLTSRAALMYINEQGRAGHLRLEEHMPFDRMAQDNLPQIVEEIRELCGMWELLDRLRIRCEARAAVVGLPFPRDGYRFWRVAALDMFALGEYIAKYIPMYEVIMLERFGDDYGEDGDENRTWPTAKRVDPVLVLVECEENDECPLCWGGNDDCALLSKLRCGHKFGRACFMRWMEELDGQNIERTCPICRRFAGCSLRCAVCNKSGHEKQMWTLGGGCNCSAVYCWGCLPCNGECCTLCGAEN